MGESVVGTSHLANGSECQDALGHCTVAGDEDILIFAVSDGAGSAKHAREAAQLIVADFCRIAEQRVAATPDDVNLMDCAEVVREALLKRAEELQVHPRELSATLLAGIVTARRGTFIQVGDGAIVGKKGGEYIALTWPESGEFVNATVFLVSPEWKKSVQQPVSDEALTDIAAFTDGLQELVLKHADRSVHQPFFPEMMAHVRGAQDTRALGNLLRSFLESADVNSRTDDDKTLLLACRTV